MAETKNTDVYIRVDADIQKFKEKMMDAEKLVESFPKKMTVEMNFSGTEYLSSIDAELQNATAHATTLQKALSSLSFTGISTSPDVKSYNPFSAYDRLSEDKVKSSASLLSTLSAEKKISSGEQQTQTSLSTNSMIISKTP